jgi:hypothetical protein
VPSFELHRWCTCERTPSTGWHRVEPVINRIDSERAAALTGKTQSAHQERHQYWIAIAMQPFCQTSEATHHAVPPAAPIIRSRWLPWFSLVARWCCFITESSMFGLNPSEVFGVILTHFDLREVSVDDEMTARVQRKLFWKLASACLVC